MMLAGMAVLPALEIRIIMMRLHKVMNGRAISTLDSRKHL